MDNVGLVRGCDPEDSNGESAEETGGGEDAAERLRPIFFFSLRRRGIFCLAKGECTFRNIQEKKKREKNFPHVMTTGNFSQYLSSVF